MFYLELIVTKPNPRVSSLRFVFNFLVPVLFFVVFRYHGAKPAIAFAIAAAVIQGLVMVLQQVAPSPFFMMAAGLTVLFGGIDLFLKVPQFFRLEPCIHSLVLGLLFLVTVIFKVSLAERFAAALPDVIRPRLDELSPGYLLRVTWAWIIYFLFKAGLYLYWALHMDLGRLIVFRSIFGTFTVFMMFGVEWFIRRGRRA